MAFLPNTDCDLSFTNLRTFLHESHNLFTPSAQWIFRGQSNAAWSLESKLERELKRFGKTLSCTPLAEAAIVREFLRRYRNYEINADIKDALEALSFIQHFGGPTRYVDWSYSIYVAAFFALYGVNLNSTATVWCFRSSFWNEPGTRENFAGRDFAKQPTTRNSEIMELFGLPMIADNGSVTTRASQLEPCIFQVAPFSHNLNIERQQGLFVMSSQPDRGFQWNLERMLEKSSDWKSWFRRIDLHCNKDFLVESLTDLRRMSVNSEVLFGGPSSLCQSLALGIVDRYNLQSAATGWEL